MPKKNELGTWVDYFTIGDLAKTVMDGNERAIRLMLVGLGAEIDPRTDDPDEKVHRDLVICLWGPYVATATGDRIRKLLGYRLPTNGER